MCWHSSAKRGKIFNCVLKVCGDEFILSPVVWGVVLCPPSPSLTTITEHTTYCLLVPASITMYPNLPIPPIIPHIMPLITYATSPQHRLIALILHIPCLTSPHTIHHPSLHIPQSERSVREVTQFLAVTELQHLDLGSCRVMVTVHEGVLARLSRQDDLLSALQEGVPPLHNNTLAFLNLDNFEVRLELRYEWSLWSWLWIKLAEYDGCWSWFSICVVFINQFLTIRH